MVRTLQSKSNTKRKVGEKCNLRREGPVWCRPGVEASVTRGVGTLQSKSSKKSEVGKKCNLPREGQATRHAGVEASVTRAI